MSDVRTRASFNLIRYAAVWEDADVLLSALDLPPGADVLCICSAGDNALSLLTTAPAAITAIDLSMPQLHLAALKKAAFQTLDYCTLLLFLADASLQNRLARRSAYTRVRPALPPDAAQFWDARLPIVEAGVVEAGKFERYFAAFRKYFLPLVHTRKTVEDLLRPKSTEEQQAFYKRHWANRRWRLLMNLFFSRFVLGRYGRDPAFLAHVKIPVSEFIRGQAERHLQSEASTRNPFLRRIFTGSYGNCLPHYLRRESFDAIRQHLDNLHFCITGAAEAMEAKPYSAYALSNIFEYMSPEDFAAFAARAAPHISPGARLAFWNLMAPRSFVQTMPEVFLTAHARNLPTDMGFFYAGFQVEERV